LLSLCWLFHANITATQCNCIAQLVEIIYCCCCCRYDDSHEQLSEAKLERLFLYSVAWSLGGLLSEKERPVFDAELRSFASNMPPK
jgi:hypothetical protein